MIRNSRPPTRPKLAARPHTGAVGDGSRGGFRRRLGAADRVEGVRGRQCRPTGPGRQLMPPPVGSDRAAPACRPSPWPVTGANRRDVCSAVAVASLARVRRARSAKAVEGCVGNPRMRISTICGGTAKGALDKAQAAAGGHTGRPGREAGGSTARGRRIAGVIGVADCLRRPIVEGEALSLADVLPSQHCVRACVLWRVSPLGGVNACLIGWSSRR